MRAPGNILKESGNFMHLEEKAAQIVDFLLGRGEGGAGAPSAPPSLRACTVSPRQHKFRVVIRWKKYA